MRSLILLFIILLFCGLSCTDKTPVEPYDPMDEFVASISFGEDTLITDLTDPVIINFKTNMIHESVEEALSIEPEIDYFTHWTTRPICNEYDSGCFPEFYVLYIYPETSFQTATTYSCLIDQSAHNIIDQNLPYDLEFGFTTDSARMIGFITESNNIEPENFFPVSVKLRFNTAIDPSFMAQPFTCTPEINYILYQTSKDKHLYEYRFADILEAETSYDFIFSEQIYDIWGNQVSQINDYIFTTDPVEVVYYFPDPDFPLRHTKPIIQVRFNTVMDKFITQEAFRLTDGVVNISGNFHWFNPKTLMYYLDSNLRERQEYEIIVTTSAVDTYGTHLKEEFRQTFIINL